jgi:hypothetical protein
MSHGSEASVEGPGERREIIFINQDALPRYCRCALMVATALLVSREPDHLQPVRSAQEIPRIIWFAMRRRTVRLKALGSDAARRYSSV